MDLKNLIQKLSLPSFPSGLGGCRSNGMNFECCEYNISIFDNKKGESIHEIDGEFIKLHHGSLSETHPAILRQFENMQIISDEQWKLRMFLTEIKEKQTKISNSYTQSCLVDAGVYATKAKEGVKTSDPLAPIWVKCSAYFLADAISLINLKRPSPTHMLKSIRGFKKNRINKNFEIVHQCLGIERASTSLLNRMLKSTIGFSDMVEANGHSKIIERKYNYLVQNSFLSDCYFYLGYINRNNLIKIKDSLHRKLDFIHILRVALDIESDLLMVEQQTSTLLKTINEILSTIKNQYV
ncbi:MAG TPA: hypothetical protein VJJ25_04565 [Nitrosopumilaceae archaeon]|nr:hypothetical protein [Nitrosopumilaceae archaeon]